MGKAHPSPSPPNRHHQPRPPHPPKLNPHLPKTMPISPELRRIALIISITTSFSSTVRSSSSTRVPCFRAGAAVNGALGWLRVRQYRPRCDGLRGGADRGRVSALAVGRIQVCHKEGCIVRNISCGGHDGRRKYQVLQRKEQKYTQEQPLYQAMARVCKISDGL